MLSPARPIRVLHVVGRMNRAGVETWLMHVLRRVDRAAISIDFLFHTMLPSAFDAEIQSLGARIIRCPGHRNPLRYGKAISRVLRAEQPYHVVHSNVHFFDAQPLYYAHRAGIPVRISHSHNDTSAAQSSSRLYRKLYYRVQRRRINSHASHRLACSGVAGRALFGTDFGQRDNDEILHYGIDLSAFQPTEDRAAVKAELGLPNDSIVIGHVGRFEPQKNHRKLMEIAGCLASRKAKAVFLLIGDGPLRADVEERAKLLNLTGRVLFAGIRGDVPRLLSNAIDVLLFPSLHEGLPVTIIESQAAGLPAVISDTICSEVIRRDDLVTRVSLNAPASDWADATERALQARTCDRSTASGDILREFDIEYSVSRLVGLYQSSLGSTRTGIPGAFAQPTEAI